MLGGAYLGWGDLSRSEEPESQYNLKRVASSTPVTSQESQQYRQLLSQANRMVRPGRTGRRQLSRCPEYRKSVAGNPATSATGCSAADNPAWRAPVTNSTQAAHPTGNGSKSRPFWQSWISDGHRVK
ncbi:hypothetical protein ACLBOM_37415 [Escherichia coli]